MTNQGNLYDLNSDLIIIPTRITSVISNWQKKKYNYKFLLSRINT
jgi:hypothetical protein